MNIFDVESLDRGPNTVAMRALVHADAHELFTLVANPHRHHEIDGGGTVQDDVIGPRELREGDKFRVSMKMGPLPYAITSRVTELVPDRVVEWQHPGGHRWRWEFDPQPEGATLVTESFDYSDTKLPALYDRIGAPERNSRGIRASLQTLQGMYPA